MDVQQKCDSHSDDDADVSDYDTDNVNAIVIQYR